MSDDETEVLSWTFYDSAKAFPHSATTLRGGVVQEMAVSLASSLGGTAGEFNLNWRKFANVDRLACRVDIFSDAWKLAADNGILLILASLGEDPTYDEVAAAFAATLNATDITDSLRTVHDPAPICPTCGKPAGCESPR